MLENLSNQTKALLIAEDLSEMSVASQENCITLQHFSYACHRSRNEAGVPYGSTVSAVLQFTIKSLSEKDGKLFYERLKSNSVYSYTFVFNATFDSRKHLSHYGDALIVSGYVVDVEDDFNTTLAPDGGTEQMLLHVKLLLSSLSYVGKDSKKTLSFVY